MLVETLAIQIFLEALLKVLLKELDSVQLIKYAEYVSYNILPNTHWTMKTSKVKQHISDKTLKKRDDTYGFLFLSEGIPIG